MLHFLEKSVPAEKKWSTVADIQYPRMSGSSLSISRVKGGSQVIKNEEFSLVAVKFRTVVRRPMND